MPIKFQRAKVPDPINLIENDVAIMRALYDYGPLSIEHLCIETGKESHAYVRRRSKMLTDHGYLVRPPIQEEVYGYRTGKGSRPLVHQLGQRGAEYLRDRYGFELNTSPLVCRENGVTTSSESSLDTPSFRAGRNARAVLGRFPL